MELSNIILLAIVVVLLIILLKLHFYPTKRAVPKPPTYYEPPVRQRIENELAKYGANDSLPVRSMHDREEMPAPRCKITGVDKKNANLIKMRWASDNRVAANNGSQEYNPELSICKEYEVDFTHRNKDIETNKYKSVTGTGVHMVEKSC